MQQKNQSLKFYLEIPNEALKNGNAKLLLHKFYNLCFSNGCSPSDWDTSDIIPIPKKDKDRRDPFQNRCISIISCVAKVYTSILNKRLQNFLESNNILADEQNGFRAGRSCVDHLFVMCTILRNRKALGKETFYVSQTLKKHLILWNETCCCLSLTKLELGAECIIQQLVSMKILSLE